MDDNLGTLISQVGRLMRKRFDERARDIGVTRPQWRVLTLLRENEGTNQGGLAELLEVEPITLGRMIDRLQEADLVERRPDPADRRAWRLYLTARGNDLIERLVPHAYAMFDQALAGIGPEEQEKLLAMLGIVRRNLSQPYRQGNDHG